MDANLKPCSVAENVRIQRGGHFTELWFGNSRTKMPVKMIQIDNTSKFHFFLRGFIFSSDPRPFSVRRSLTSLINNKLFNRDTRKSQNSRRPDTGLFLENKSTGWVFWKCWLEIEILFIIFTGMRLYTIHIQSYLLWNEQTIALYAYDHILWVNIISK